MSPLILPFDAIRADDLPKAGGKGANLGELTRAGFLVPPGYYVTTNAFSRFMAEAPEGFYAQLESLERDNIERLRQVGNQVRSTLQGLRLPGEVADAVVDAWRETGEEYPYAVRSSATAEDLPHASFAGQHDTYLNVRGEEVLLERIKACFISLFTDRAILYRIQNGFDHRKVALAVVVQRMVLPDVSGILFTADPVSGNRNIVSIDASFGLGEALVSGLVSADLYKVHKKTRRIITRQMASKHIAIRPRAEGDTQQVELAEEQRNQASLNDDQILALAELGAQIETHFGRPQDIEWALAEADFYILQSRPITSLYPLPEPEPENDGLHVYVSLPTFRAFSSPCPPWRSLPCASSCPWGMSIGNWRASGLSPLEVVSTVMCPPF